MLVPLYLLHCYEFCSLIVVTQVCLVFWYWYWFVLFHFIPSTNNSNEIELSQLSGCICLESQLCFHFSNSNLCFLCFRLIYQQDHIEGHKLRYCG